jgi:hypothetical protein
VGNPRGHADGDHRVAEAFARCRSAPVFVLTGNRDS